MAAGRLASGKQAIEPSISPISPLEIHIKLEPRNWELATPYPFCLEESFCASCAGTVNLQQFRVKEYFLPLKQVEKA